MPESNRSLSTLRSVKRRSRTGPILFLYTYQKVTPHAHTNQPVMIYQFICEVCGHENQSLRCRSCQMRGKGNPFYGKTHTDESIQKFARSGLKNGFGGRTHTEKSKKQMSISAKKRMSKRDCKTGLTPNYNPDACQFFEMLNERLNWNGIHAENGGEYRVKNFFVDFYEPARNVVIEWDEPHAHEPRHRKRDQIRQQQIQQELNCNFIRIGPLTKDPISVILRSCE